MREDLIKQITREAQKRNKLQKGKIEQFFLLLIFIMLLN